jgi:hypothetical protein
MRSYVDFETYRNWFPRTASLDHEWPRRSP